MNGFTLRDLKVGQSCVVTGVYNKGIMRRRMMDIGIVPGTVIDCVLSSPSGNPMAYRIKNSLIALRNSDALEVGVDLL